MINNHYFKGLKIINYYFKGLKNFKKWSSFVQRHYATDKVLNITLPLIEGLWPQMARTEMDYTCIT